MEGIGTITIRLCLAMLSTDVTGELDVLGHDGNELRVDRAQVGVLKEADEVGIICLLKRQDGSALEAHIGLDVLCNLIDEELEWRLANSLSLFPLSARCIFSLIIVIS
jgi:hypothetical protein